MSVRPSLRLVSFPLSGGYSRDSILDRAARFSARLRENAEAVEDLLISYESHEAARDEVERSLKCLENLQAESEALTYRRLRTISTFFPLNLPLYSLVLFALVPAMTAERVYVRPPLLMAPLLRDLFDLLDIAAHFPEVRLIEAERRAFLEDYAAVSDVVLFCGKIGNALKIRDVCRDSLFIYNGAGVNPILVTPSADLNLAVEKAAQARTFNSGQDCAGPDSLLVHADILGAFLNRLTARLSTLRVGDYVDRDVTIGRIVDTTHLDAVGGFLRQHQEHIVYGGTIDYRKATVHPTVVTRPLSEYQNFTELFSPVFFVSSYRSEEELDLFFQRDKYLDFAMYASVFGETAYTGRIRNSVILHDRNVLDVEEGNRPYGGFGPRANFAWTRRKTVVRPILISREIHDWLKDRDAAAEAPVEELPLAA